MGTHVSDLKAKQFEIAICLSSQILGEGLKRLLEMEMEFANTIGRCFSDPVEAVNANPSLLIMDFQKLSSLPEERTASERLKILLVETSSMPRMIESKLGEMINRGLCGITPLMSDVAQFKCAVRTVLEGDLWLDGKTVKEVIRRMKQQEDTRPALTKRESEVVKLVCKGFRNKEIMGMLSISEQAVKSHLNRIYKKVGVSDRLQLALHVTKFWSNPLD